MKKDKKQTKGKAPAKKSAVKPATTKKQNKDTVSMSKKKSVDKPVKSAQSQFVTVEIKIHNDANGGHPHILVDTLGDKNVSVGTTHSAKKGKSIIIYLSNITR